MASSNSPQWASLRSDVLFKIAKCLDTRVDILRFRAVCYSWRSSIPLPPKIPCPYSTLKLPFPIGPNPYLNPNRRSYFLLKETTIYALQPLTKISNSWNTTKTWLIQIEDSKSDKVILKDPLFRFPFENLHKKLPKDLNLLDYRVIEISKAHRLEFVQQGKAPEIEFNELKSTTIKKAVTSSSLDKIGDGFAVMALHTGGKLGVWRMGDKKWNNINDNRDRSHYDDIIYHNGKFYALNITGLVVSVDPVTLKSTDLSTVMYSGYGYGGQFKYLVKSSGDLFRIDKYIIDDFELNCYSSDSDDERPVPLVIYKLDEEKHDWVMVEGLDDRVIFIGDDASFSVFGKDFNGCKSNSVYYYDDSFSKGNDDHPGFEAGIFDLEDRKAGPLAKFPSYSKVFWPPPTWLKSNPYVRLPKGFSHSLTSHYSVAMDSSSPQWPQWATLQRDLLFKIANCLDTRTDLLHFRAVCNSWRSSIPHTPKTSSPHPSLKLPFPIFPNQPFNRSRRGHFVLTESTIYALQPLKKMSSTLSATDTETYLVKAEELETGQVILKDPLSLFTFTPFSTLRLMEEMPEVLSLLDYKVSEVSNAYGLVFLDQAKTPVTNVFTDSDDHKSICMKKVVVSSSFYKIDEKFGFAVMALDFDGNVGVWKMGDEKWTNINDNRKGSCYVDVSFHNGKFYALDITELTITVDPKNFQIRRIVRSRSGFGFGANRFSYLVKSFENLFRVDKLDFSLGDSPFAHSCDFDVNYPILFLIYKLNEEKKEWVKMSGLEDHALFIGCDCSFSVSANNFPGCKRNCVYFLDDSFDEDDNDGLLAAGFFALEDFRSMRLSKFPCYSKIFYPPPAWLKNNPTLSNC